MLAKQKIWLKHRCCSIGLKTNNKHMSTTKVAPSAPSEQPDIVPSVPTITSPIASPTTQEKKRGEKILKKTKDETPEQREKRKEQEIRLAQKKKQKERRKSLSNSTTTQPEEKERYSSSERTRLQQAYAKIFRKHFLTRWNFQIDDFEDETKELKYCVKEMEKNTRRPFDELIWLKDFLIIIQTNESYKGTDDDEVNTSLQMLSQRESVIVANNFRRIWDKDPVNTISKWQDKYDSVSQLNEQQAFFGPFLKLVLYSLNRESVLKNLRRLRWYFACCCFSFFAISIVFEFLGCRLGCCLRGDVCPRDNM